MPQLTIRFAEPEDATTIHRFILELAIYEKEPDAVEATPASLRAQLEADPAPFQCILAEVDGEPVGFALYFFNYSTWRGQQGIYLEDLYVQPERRGAGFGLALLRQLSAVAVHHGCSRLDWQVLDWNQPSIEFYEALGAEINRNWIPCRLTGPALAAMAAAAPFPTGDHA